MDNSKNQRGVLYNIIDIIISLYLFEEEKKIVVYAPTLKLQAYGDTEEETLKHFTTKLHLFILEIYTVGGFKEIFEDLGWRVFQAGFAVELDPPSFSHLKSSDSRFLEIL